jgi:hypothetical protein
MAKVKSLDEKFFQYHSDNPHIFDLFLSYARQVKGAGFKHYGFHTIMHRVRWHLNIETTDPEGYKMNNNYSSRYARLLAKKNPEFKGFFRNRKLTTFSVLESS